MNRIFFFLLIVLFVMSFLVVVTYLSQIKVVESGVAQEGKLKKLKGELEIERKKSAKLEKVMEKEIRKLLEQNALLKEKTGQKPNLNETLEALARIEEERKLVEKEANNQTLELQKKFGKKGSPFVLCLIPLILTSSFEKKRICGKDKD